MLWVFRSYGSAVLFAIFNWYMHFIWRVFLIITSTVSFSLEAWDRPGLLFLLHLLTYFLITTLNHFHWYSRKGCCHDHRLFTLHADSILEDLVVTLADGIASNYLELISVDGSLSDEISSLGLVLCKLSTRSLQRLRNEVQGLPFFLTCLGIILSQLCAFYLLFLYSKYLDVASWDLSVLMSNQNRNLDMLSTSSLPRYFNIFPLRIFIS